MTWNSHCFQLLDLTQKYVHTDQNQPNIKHQWIELIKNCQSVWEKLSRGSLVIFDFENPEEQQEEEILQEDLEEIEDDSDLEYVEIE
jgi:hypothetical protein